MRPISLLCMLLAIGSGLYLYRVKYRAQMLDREIHATLRAADETRARAGLLRADYALLNDPIRLQELIDQHLPLKSTQPGQFTTLAELERRLPPIGLAPPEPRPEPEIPAAIIRPEPKIPVAEPRAPEPRIVERPAPVVAAATPRPVAPPPRPAAIAPTPTAPTPTALAVAAAPRAPTPLALPGSAAPMVTQVARAAPAPAPAPRPQATAPSPQIAEAAPVVVRSSLGMARRPISVVNSPTGPGGGAEN